VPERRSTRLALEVLFLAALATALSFADLRPVVVAGAMLVGWLLAAIFEWASLRGEPHWGSGSPPRYYVPRVRLPPSLPLERPQRFPVPDAPEAPTWFTPRRDRDDDWPWPSEPDRPAALEETVVREPVPRAAPEVEAPEPVEAEPRTETAEPVAAVAEPRVLRTSRHRIDPLEPPPGRRRRRRNENDGMIEVPARPTVRVLPGASRREE